MQLIDILDGLAGNSGQGKVMPYSHPDIQLNEHRTIMAKQLKVLVEQYQTLVDQVAKRLRVERTPEDIKEMSRCMYYRDLYRNQLDQQKKYEARN